MSAHGYFDMWTGGTRNWAVCPDFVGQTAPPPEPGAPKPSPQGPLPSFFFQLFLSHPLLIRCLDQLCLVSQKVEATISSSLPAFAWLNSKLENRQNRRQGLGTPFLSHRPSQVKKIDGATWITKVISIWSEKRSEPNFREIHLFVVLHSRPQISMLW